MPSLFLALWKLVTKRQAWINSKSSLFHVQMFTTGAFSLLIITMCAGIQYVTVMTGVCAVNTSVIIFV